jgi:hypothetical protein
MPRGLDLPNLFTGGALGGVVGYAATAFSVWRRRPFVSFIDFLRAEPPYDFSPVAGGPAYYGSGHIYKVILVLAGRDAPGLATLELTYTAPDGKTWRRYGKWDEAPNPLNWDDPGQFWPALVPASYQQVVQFDRVYAIPIVSAPVQNSPPFAG